MTGLTVVTLALLGGLFKATEAGVSVPVLAGIGVLGLFLIAILAGHGLLTRLIGPGSR